jgi:hypothetical protein
VFLQFADSRPWYYLLRDYEGIEDQFDCLVTTYDSPEGNRSLITIKGFHIGWVQNIHSLLPQLAAVNRYTVKDVVSVHTVVWAINGVALYWGLDVTNTNNISRLRLLIYLEL